MYLTYLKKILKRGGPVLEFQKFKPTCFYWIQHDATTSWGHTIHLQVPGLLRELQHSGTLEIFHNPACLNQLATGGHEGVRLGGGTDWWIDQDRIG